MSRAHTSPGEKKKVRKSYLVIAPFFRASPPILPTRPILWEKFDPLNPTFWENFKTQPLHSFIKGGSNYVFHAIW